jgi:hypothetical protein
VLALRVFGRLVGFMLVLAVAAIRLGLVAGPLDVWGKPDISPQGFTGDVRQPPSAGAWRATGTYTVNKGYNGRAVGDRIQRLWTTNKDCRLGTCSYSITRELEGLPSTTAPLTLRADGWYAHFPALVLPCQPGHTWAQHDTFVFRFTDRGRRLEAHEARSSYARACGYGVARVEWTAELIQREGEAVEAGGVTSDDVGSTSEARAMAASVRRAVDRDIRRIVLRISAARGQRIGLPGRPHYSSCRPGGEGRSRAEFVCRVAILAKNGLFGIRVLVTEVDGRCWQGINDRWEEPGKGEFPYPDTKLQRQLAAKPLRGCAARPLSPPADSSRRSSQLPRV